MKELANPPKGIMSHMLRTEGLKSPERVVSTEGRPRSDWPVGMSVGGCLD